MPRITVVAFILTTINMKTKEDILKESTKRTLNINEGSPLHDAVMKAMEEYAQQQVKNFSIPVVSGNYYWVKLMTDDKHEPAIAINLLGIMNFQFFNGVVVPCDKVNDYSECNYI